MLDAATRRRLPAGLHELTVAQAGALLRAGELTSAELTEDALARIGRLDPALHAFITVTGETALSRAAAADRDLRAGLDRGPMHGIPYALKDIIDAEGVPTTSASALRAGHVAGSDSTVESRMRAGGGVLVGKLTTFEFAIGGPSFDLPFPPARNPWSEEHVPSGSSSGAGAAVAAGLVRVALASDTSGSIRGPAFHCGTAGLKPSYGRVSGHGAQVLSHTLDHFGVLAWTVADAAAALRVVAGADPADPRTADVPVPDYAAEAARGVAGLRIAWSPGWYADDPATAPEIVAGIERALRVLTGLGASVERVELPSYHLFNACGRVICAAEAFAVHEDDLRAHPRSFGRYTYQRVMPGIGITAADLVRAYQVRRRLTRLLDQTVFADHDVLITACGQATAARWTDFGPDWPPPRLANDMQTIPFSVSGHPALAVPIGFAPAAPSIGAPADSSIGSSAGPSIGASAGSPVGLPIGLQAVGRAFGEASLLRVGAAIEAELGQRHVRPPQNQRPPAERPRVVCHSPRPAGVVCHSPGWPSGGRVPQPPSSGGNVPQPPPGEGIPLATDYSSGALSKDNPDEHERLRLLEAWGDPDTHAVMRTIGLASGWRCLEIGAGAGSVARWLAGQCADGSVVAVDMDTRYLSEHEPGNLEWRCCDIHAADLPDGSFDLVHSRVTFCHLADREEMVGTAARWLAPGGWLVIGDPMCMPAAGSAHEPVRRFFGALETAWQAQGSDMTRWAQTIPSQLARVGLRDIGVLTRANCLGEKGPYGRLAFANLRQEGRYLVQRGLLEQRDVDAVIDLCADPGFTDIRSITVYAWGRRVTGEGSC